MFRNMLQPLSPNDNFDGDASTKEKELIEGTIDYIDIPYDEDTKEILAYTFYALPNLTEVYIPSNITTINKKAFTGNTSIQKITIAKKSGKIKNSPWGAPATCTIVWDEKAKPRYSDPDIVSPVDVPSTTSTPNPSNYRIAMRDLLQEMRNYINVKNHPGFLFLNNGGSDIFNVDEKHDWTEAEIAPLYNITDGVTIEDVFYGVNANWNQADDMMTPVENTESFMPGIQQLQAHSVPAFIIDYCSTESNVVNSRQRSAAIGCVSFQANVRELTKIPPNINNENTESHYDLTTIKNFLVLLNSDQFPTKKEYMDALSVTNYDCFIIDLTTSEDSLNKDDLKRLKYKPNGARRLVICYMSLGEAEDYRSYWNSDWTAKMPEWCDKENPDWKGNFKVKYWTAEWKKILFGTSNSYIDTIVNLGFDGVFLDVIDAYSYFEEG